MAKSGNDSVDLDLHRVFLGIWAVQDELHRGINHPGLVVIDDILGWSWRGFDSNCLAVERVRETNLFIS